MIIDVQTTRNETKDDAANPYGFTEEKPSRKPLILGGLLAGFALYLKSRLPGLGRDWQRSWIAGRGRDTPRKNRRSRRFQPTKSCRLQGDVSSSEETRGRVLSVFPAPVAGWSNCRNRQAFCTVETNEIVLVELASPAVEIRTSGSPSQRPCSGPPTTTPRQGGGAAGGGDVADDDLAEDIGDDDLPPDDDEPVVDR